MYPTSDVDKKKKALIYTTYPSQTCTLWNQGVVHSLEWAFAYYYLMKGLGFNLEGSLTHLIKINCHPIFRAHF